MLYQAFLTRTLLILIGILSVTASTEDLLSRTQNEAQYQIGKNAPTHQNRSSGKPFLSSSLPRQFQRPSANTKFVRGGGKRSLVESKQIDDQSKRQSIAKGIESIRVNKRQWKRKEVITLFVLRIGFLISLPFSVLFLAASLVFWSVAVIIRILTLNFAARELSAIAFAACKALVALTFASLTGIVLPVFAMFGLVASLTAAVIEMAEPILRIRYRKLLRKVRHLQKILNDPVLMETIDIMSRGAQAITVASSNQARRVSKRVIKSGSSAYDKTSAQLIETLLQSPSSIAWQESVKNRLPDSVAAWTKDQVEILRKSGVLEEAAARALNVLSKSEELSKAATLLPYIEAISQVQRNMKKN